MSRLHLFLTTTLLFLPFATAHSQIAKIVDHDVTKAHKLTAEDKRRIVTAAQDPKLNTLREETALLLEIYAVDQFLQRNDEGRRNARLIANAMVADGMLFPERLIQEIEHWKKSNPWRIAAAIDVLSAHPRKLSDEARFRLWKFVPQLREHRNARVRHAAVQIVFMCQHLRDALPWFVQALDDLEIPEGASMPVAGYAITGITESRKFSADAVQKILSFLDSANGGVAWLLKRVPCLRRSLAATV